MSAESEESSARPARIVTLLAVLGVAAAIAIPNLSSEPVSGDLIQRIADAPERACGWPVTWYWQVATTVPGNITPMGDSTARSVLQWPVARYSASGLTADLMVWLGLLAGAAVVSQRLLKRYQLRLRWRPRVTTVIVLLVVALPIVLSNLSFEVSPPSSHYWGERGAVAKASFGWPLIWNWYFVAPYDDLYGWEFSALHLAGNLVFWLGVLAGIASLWEWIMRRFRPQLSFSLRTMMAAIVLLSLLCAWGAAVWQRANEQDAIAASAFSISNVRVARWGPRWLGLVVPDRYRRCVIDLSVCVDGRGDVTDDEETDDFDEIDAEDAEREQQELLQRLARLSALRTLSVDCGLLTPALTDALANLQQLRTLTVSWHDRSGAGIDVSWIGRLAKLENLWLTGVDSNQLSCLTRLTHLKSLRLDLSDCKDDEPEMEKRLAIVGKLTGLSRLYVDGAPGTQIVYLRGLTNLKSLTLDFDQFLGDDERVRECFAALGKLSQLEQLSLSGGVSNLGARQGLRVHAPNLQCLRELIHLESLRIEISCDQSEQQECLVAIGSLTQLKRLWIEGDLVSGGLGELARLESLEELTSHNGMATTSALRSLLAFKRLRAIHIAGLDMDLDSHTFVSPLFKPKTDAHLLRRAVESLRYSHPGIVIDGDYPSRWGTGDWEDSMELLSEPFEDKFTNLDHFLGFTVFFMP
ncbi:MAG TPA: hypothetical protein VHC22_21425 [Pirellulales bacterium]|nr:hypothetical protein [Pirellulales bacterium]